MEKLTITEAAAKWIAMIEAPATKATQEEKAAMIANVTAAAPKTIGMNTYGNSSKLSAATKLEFPEAVRLIRIAMKGGK